MSLLHCISMINISKIQSPDLLFVVAFISFYISRYHFHKFLELYSTLSEEKIFVTNFPFLADSLKPPRPSPTPLMTKIR